MKKIIPHLLFNGIICLVLTAAYIGFPGIHEPFEVKLRDHLFLLRGPVPDSGRILVVAIDEGSLDELGPWPWERYKIARILHRLDGAGALLIGMDMVFSAHDRTSPHYVARQFQLGVGELPDYDAMMADAIANTPVVMGYMFDMERTRKIVEPPLADVEFTEDAGAGLAFVPEVKGVVANLPELRRNAISAGFLNYVPDEGGVIRSIPLFFRHGDHLYGSFTFELFRLLRGSPAVTVDTARTGVTGVRFADYGVPTDPAGRMHLNFYGPAGSFDYLSAADVFNGRFDSGKVRDRVVLMGASAVGLLDLLSTPFDRSVPGVEIHATALDNLLRGDLIHRPDWVIGADVLLLVGIGLSLALVHPFLPAYLMFALLATGLYSIHLLASQLLFQHGLIINLLFPTAATILMTISSTFINFFFEAREKRRIRASFARKVSASVVEDLLKHGGRDVLVGRSEEITIFFSDVRGFTNLTERLAVPEKVIDLLNIYMTPMVEEVMRTAGTVDKLIGDAVMAYWNAPNRVADHADQAVMTGLRQLERLGEVNERLREKFQLEIDIGIGINTGVAVVGEMGSEGRSDYTIIGDPVNLASRLEGLCKQYGSRVIISEYTHDRLHGAYSIRELDMVRVKGKQDPVKIFEVLGKQGDAGIGAAELSDYHMALTAYREGRFAEAKDRFTELEGRNPTGLYRLYIGRCTEYLEHPPEQFDGVYVHTSK